MKTVTTFFAFRQRGVKKRRRICSSLFIYNLLTTKTSSPVDVEVVRTANFYNARALAKVRNSHTYDLIARRELSTPFVVKGSYNRVLNVLFNKHNYLT